MLHKETVSAKTLDLIQRLMAEEELQGFTYTRVAFAKRYTTKHAITSAEVLNDCAIPFFEGNAIPILRRLTDLGTEFNGRPENYEYELYLQLENIDHSRTKVRHPQSNGICERLHRTMQDGFYAVAFRVL